jgi:hypothetical protein
LSLSSNVLLFLVRVLSPTLTLLLRGGSKKNIPGWNDAAHSLKSQANFWYKVWIEAGCPSSSSGVLHSIKKSSKSRFKYEVRRLKRKEHHLQNEKLIAALAAKKTFASR